MTVPGQSCKVLLLKALHKSLNDMDYYLKKKGFDNRTKVLLEDSAFILLAYNCIKYEHRKKLHCKSALGELTMGVSRCPQPHGLQDS
jgi:hypothetical protein